MRRYRLTTMAAEHFERIGNDTAAKWGDAQARAYLIELREGFQVIANRHERLPLKSAGLGALRLHRVNHHYVVFSVLAEDRIAVVSILHERMDVSTRLRAVQARLDRDLADVRRAILKDNLSEDS